MALRRADHIFCLNTEDEQFMRSRYLRTSQDITRIFPGADSIYGRNAAARDYKRSSVVLFAGTWLVRKGIRDLVVAFTRLANADPSSPSSCSQPRCRSERCLERLPRKYP